MLYKARKKPKSSYSEESSQDLIGGDISMDTSWDQVGKLLKTAKDEGMHRADEVNIELYGGPTHVTKDHEGYNYLTTNWVSI